MADGRQNQGADSDDVRKPIGQCLDYCVAKAISFAESHLHWRLRV
jgi:hypothetical protein